MFTWRPVLLLLKRSSFWFIESLWWAIRAWFVSRPWYDFSLGIHLYTVMLTISNKSKSFFLTFFLFFILLKKINLRCMRCNSLNPIYMPFTKVHIDIDLCISSFFSCIILVRCKMASPIIASMWWLECLQFNVLPPMKYITSCQTEIQLKMCV